MTSHDHRMQTGAALASAAQAAFERAGEQWTPMRAAVHEALSGSAGRPASAYDIAATIAAKSGRRVAANSVYRILDLFTAANLAVRVESANAYLVNAHPDCVHDCIFMVCDDCARIAHVDNDAVTSTVRQVAIAAGFTVHRPVVEVRGRCAACTDART